MKLSQVLFHDDIPTRYYYCSTGNKEYILTGTKDGYIFNSDSSYTVGSIVVSILEEYKNILKIIEKYIKIIEDENCVDDEEINQVKVCSYLTELQKELFKPKLDLFHYVDFSKDISNKFIEKISELNIEKEKYNSKNDDLIKLKQLLNVNEFPNNNKVLDFFNRENNHLRQKIEKLENLSFKNFTLEYLNNFLLDFNSSIFNFILYFGEVKKLEIEYDNKKINLSNEVERKILLQTNYNNISTDKNISWTKMAIISNNRIYLEQLDKIKDYSIKDIKMLHIFEFDTLIDLFNLSLINAIDKQVTIKKCKNCGYYFIPENRTDEVYCNRISPQNSNKTCKEYGAKKTYREEIKSTPIKYEHNKTSQYFRMKIKRCFDEKEKEKLIIKFDKYKTDYAKKKKQYNNKKIIESDFAEWIKSQKNISQ